FANVFFDGWRQVRVGADGAGKFANRHDFTGALEAFVRAMEFVVHECQLEAEGGGFAVDAVAAANARRHFVLVRAAGDDGQQFFDIGNQNIRALNHLHGEGGVHDVAAGEAEMKPAAG